MQKVSNQPYDYIVVGAGVAGGIFASSQTKDKKILVVERNLNEQERIVGELMQPGGVELLKQLNLSHLLDSIDVQKIDGYKLIDKEKSFLLNYEEINDTIEGFGLRNEKFLTNIRENLRQQSNITLIEGNVVKILEEGNTISGIIYSSQEEKNNVAKAKLTIISDGSMSLLRPNLTNSKKIVTSFFAGLILRDLKLDSPMHGHMILSGKTPVLVYPIATNQYRILIDIPGQKAPRNGDKLKSELKANLENILPEEMRASFVKAIDNDELKIMPNHRFKGQVFRKNGAVLLGDSLNMRHPLTGGGMTASISDIVSLNKALNKQNDLSDQSIELALKEYYTNRTANVETINILANALYEVFSDKELKKACFEYLEKGGENAIGPMSILAGINRDKKFLLKHFYRVAMQKPQNFVLEPIQKVKMLFSARKIIRPLLKEENSPSFTRN